MLAGLIKEPFAILLVITGMIYQGLFGKEKEPFDQTGDPILLSHGYLGTSGQLFYLKQQLKKHHAVFTIDYAHPLVSIDTFAAEMKKKVEEIQRYYPGKKITLIGHSMGGIIAARYAANCENTDHIAKIITLGSPLQGSYAAYLGPGKCAHEMRPKSLYLSKLESDLLLKNIDFINATSNADLLVLTASFDRVPSKKVHFPNIGHMTYLVSKQIAIFLNKSML